MPCIIQKFGGACFADTKRLFAVARKIVSGDQLPVVVVSAQQGMTYPDSTELRGGGHPRSVKAA
jgi:aspartokinase